MKGILYSLVVASSLASCAQRDPAPVPALTGDTWTLQSKITVGTPKDGSAPTKSAYPITENVTIAFQSATRFRMEVSKSPGSGAQRFEGNYSYQGQILSFPAINSWPTPFVVPRTLTVVQLSAHQLVTEWHWDEIDIGDGYYTPTSYITTDTYTR